MAVQGVEQLGDTCNAVTWRLNKTPLIVTNQESEVAVDSNHASSCEMKPEEKINKLEQ